MAITFNNKRQASSSVGTVNQTVNALFVVASGPTYTARSLTGATDIYADTAVAGDYYILSVLNSHNKPGGLEFDVTTAMVSTSHTITWEYRKTDGTWAAFAGVVDNTAGFTVVGTNTVTWTMPTDWGTNATAINSYTGRLWLRALISAAVGITEGGRTTLPLQLFDYAITIDGSSDYANGTATSGSTTTIVDTSKAWAINELAGRGVYIHTGTNAGVMRRIISNSATAITILDVFDTAIDSTSQYTVGHNYEDIYQASVAGGWGVATKAGEHSYAFSCHIRFGLATFIDFQVQVEHTNDFYFYVGEAHSNRYPMFLGWRPPLMYGLNRGIFGCTITSNRTACVDNRGLGFTMLTEFLFTCGNTYILRHDYQPGSDSFLRDWFNNYHRYSIDDRWEGWRSVLFPKTTTPRTEVRKPTVIFGHSGYETPNAAISEPTGIYNTSLTYFQTLALDVTFPDADFSPNSILSGSRYSSSMQWYNARGITNLDDFKGARFRLFGDVFGSSPNSGSTNWRNSFKGFVTDEQGNLLSNAKIEISDSLAQNRKTYLDFDGAVGNNDTLIAPNHATGNQFSGSTTFSFEAWVFPRTSGGGTVGRVFEKGTSGTVGYGIHFNGNTWRAFVFTSTGLKNSNTITATYFAWHHVVAVWDGTTLQLYVDNQAAGTVAAAGTSTNDTANALYIGSSVTASRTLNGEIRRVRLFRNKALTVDDVTTLWNNGDYTQNQASPVAGCTAEYNFTEGSGTTVADTSGNGVTATLGASTAAPIWRDTNAGLSANAMTVFTGTKDKFLEPTTIVSAGTYSLTTQPTNATRLRFVISNCGDKGSGTTANANLLISGTDGAGNAIQEIVFVETFENGVYFTKNEFLTVDASGILVNYFSGTLSCDDLGIIPPQKIVSETWRNGNDVNVIVADYNPIIIKVSRPGYEPTVIKKALYEKQDITVALKKSVLKIT